MSSTFSDFQRERRWLHERVRPTLIEMARHFGLDLELSDFRWGVTRVDIEHDRTVALCLQEVDICRRLSPEANFLVFLGDRAGSRILPATASHDALDRLLTALRAVQDPAAREVLRSIEQLFPVAEANGRMRRSGSASDAELASRFAADAAAARCLAALACPEPAADELRRALAFSITHREILRSGIGTAGAGNAGAVALIRAHGEADDMQAAMRRRVEAALGPRAFSLGETDGYESDFIECCTRLVGDLLVAARPRGTRAHYFFSLRETPPLSARTAPRHPELLRHLERWATATPAGPAAVIGPRGAGRSDALGEAAAHLQVVAPGARVVLLSLGAQPDLEHLPTFAAALSAAVRPGPHDGDAPDTRGTRAQVISRALAALRDAERSHSLFLLIDDLDRLDGGRGIDSAAWLWSEAASRRVLFSAHDSVTLDPAIEAVRLGPLSPADLRRCAELYIAALEAPDLDADEVTRFVTSARPGDVETFVRIASVTAVDVQSDRTGHRRTEFIASALDDLLRRAPFSRRICDLFFGLCLIPEVGVSDGEFLTVCQESTDIRAELQGHFPHGRFLDVVPSLVWHRLVAHFSPVVDARFRHGGQAWCVRDDFAVTVARAVGAAAAHAVEVLANLYLKDLDRIGGRGVEVLPRLLASLGRHAELATLALAPGFMKQAVVTQRSDALRLAIASAPSPGAIVDAVLAGVDGVGTLSAEGQSHWLLDLSVVSRQLGFAREAASLATRAYEVRKEILGPADALTVAACLEATDSLLEAGHHAPAERLADEVLAAVSSWPDLAVRRLKLNHASAQVHQRRLEDAEAAVRALLPALEADTSSRDDLISAHNLLGICCQQRGASDEAHAHAARAVELSSRLLGRRTRDTAVVMLNLAMIELNGGRADAAVATLEEVLSVYRETLDMGHPWLENAEHVYFGALVGAGRLPAAVAFLEARLKLVSAFESAAPWIIVAARPLAAELSAGRRVGIRPLCERIDHLMTSSSSDSWTGELVGRFMRRIGAAFGVEGDESKGLMIAVHYLWTLVVVAAVRAEVLTTEEARRHLGALELRVGRILGSPAPLPCDERVEKVWRHFTRQDWPAELRVLHELAASARPMGLIDAFKALEGRTSPLAALASQARAAIAQGCDSDAAGQALIMLAARAAATGDFEVAIHAQSEVVAMAERLYGGHSFQRSTAILNLGALHFRAGRFGEAFDGYRDGLEQLYAGDAEVERFGQVLQNAFHAGLEARRYGDAALLMALLARRSGGTPVAIQFGAMASVALLRDNRPQAAVASFIHALWVFEALKAGDAATWAKTVADMAGMFVDRIAAPEAASLDEALRSVEARAEAGGWRAALADLPEWGTVRSAFGPRQTRG